MSRLKYILHPNWVRSINDGQEHYISGAQLAELYRLPKGSWIEFDPDKRFGWRANINDLIHLGTQKRPSDYHKIAVKLMQTAEESSVDHLRDAAKMMKRKQP